MGLRARKTGAERSDGEISTSGSSSESDCDPD